MQYGRRVAAQNCTILPEEAEVSLAQRVLHAVVTFVIAVASFADAPAHIRAARLLSHDVGWLLTDDAVLRTDDGGSTWRDVTPTGLPAAAIRSASFGTASTAHVAVISPGLLRRMPMLLVMSSDNGGEQWSSARVSLQVEEGDELDGFVSLDFANGPTGWLLAGLSSTPNSSRARLFRTRDGGATWIEMARPPIAGALRFVSDADGWLVGGAGRQDLFVTHDGGLSWHRDPLTSLTRGLRFRVPIFEDAVHGKVIAEDPGPYGRTLVFSTEDGGRSWRASGAFPPGRTLTVAGTGDVIALSRQQDEGTRIGVPLTADAVLQPLDFVSNDGGWVLSTRGYCRAFKTDCTQETRLFAADGEGRLLREVSPVRPASSAEALHGNVDLHKWRAHPDSSGSTGVLNDVGFDACAAPTPDFMSTWWAFSPYSAIGIYIGGSRRGCAQPNMPDSGWTSTVTGQGWALIPLWVGPQAVGWDSPYPGTIGVNANAYQQGQDEASAAATAANGYGLAGTIVYYDLERYDAPSSTAHNDAKSFIRGWVDGMRSRGLQAGVYMHIHNAVDDLASLWGNASAPDAVWIAKPFTQRPQLPPNFSTFGLADGSTPFPDSLWPSDQRLRQYYLDQGTVNGSDTGADDETFGGTAKLATDNDLLAGPAVFTVGQKFSVGDTIRANTSVHVRPQPGSSTFTTTMAAGSTGVIQEAPVVATFGGVTYQWWHVHWQDGSDGWSVEYALDVVSGGQSSCYSLSRSSNPMIGGSTSANPNASIPCNIGYYQNLTQITLTASPASGYQFSNWTGSGGFFSSNTQATTTFTITGNAQVIANFASTPTPTIGLSVTAMTFTGQQGGGGPSSQPLTISNTGSGTLNWSASADASWISLSSSSGTAPSTISVFANLGNLNAGTYQGTVTVSAAGASNTPQTVAVTFVVSPPSTGTINVAATLDGNGWPSAGSGLVTLNLSGPSGGSSVASVPSGFCCQPTGSYTLSYISGGPSGATVSGISPSATQVLNAGASITFTVNFATLQNPVPSISNVSPPSITAGDPSFTLTVSGSGFIGSSTIDWNGSAQQTTYVAANQLTTVISSGQIASQGSATVTVVNPAPGGGMSNAQSVLIQPRMGFGAPTLLSVTYVRNVFNSGSPGVIVSWTGVTGAVDYESEVNGFVQDLQYSGTTIGFTGYAEPVCYAVRIRAIDASGTRSAWSGRGIATSVTFSDDPLVAGSTVVKAVHFNEIRAAIATVRTAAGLPAFSFTDVLAPGAPVRAIHLLELRNALNGALSALSIANVTFADPVAGVTLIHASDLQRLRDAMK
jgi:hypothetical protein